MDRIRSYKYNHKDRIRWIEVIYKPDDYFHSLYSSSTNEIVHQQS